MTSKSSLIRTIENQRRQFFRMEQANKELKAQLEQQAKSIEVLVEGLDGVANVIEHLFMQISDEDMTATIGVATKHLSIVDDSRAIANKFKANKQDK